MLDLFVPIERRFVLAIDALADIHIIFVFARNVVAKFARNKLNIFHYIRNQTGLKLGSGSFRKGKRLERHLLTIIPIKSSQTYSSTHSQIDRWRWRGGLRLIISAMGFLEILLQFLISNNFYYWKKLIQSTVGEIANL